MVSLDMFSGILKLQEMRQWVGYGRKSMSYRDDPPETFEHITLGPTVE